MDSIISHRQQNYSCPCGLHVMCCVPDAASKDCFIQLSEDRGPDCLSMNDSSGLPNKGVRFLIH